MLQQLFDLGPLFKEFFQVLLFKITILIFFEKIFKILLNRVLVYLTVILLHFVNALMPLQLLPRSEELSDLELLDALLLLNLNDLKILHLL
jgi:hypothetical protein